MSATERENVIVIGAGPGGLATGYCLAERGVDALLLEAGDSAGWSWSNMPRNIGLLSPWKVNHLPGTKPTLVDQHALHSCHAFSAYLRSYASEHRLRLQPKTAVQTIKREAHGFAIHTNAGVLRAKAVVNATGYFSKPRMPDYHGMHETNVRQIHVHDFKSAAETHASLGVQQPRVLVVGRRISAGQTIAELHDAGLGYEVVLSRRGPITFARPPWLLKLAFWGFYRWEDKQVARDPFALDDTFPPMEGGREKTLLVSGRVRQVPDIARFHADDIEFVDNSRERFDLVIYTTGFRPALDHLRDVTNPDAASGLPPMIAQQSSEAPGLFFVGMDKQRSFRSRYLRGIREDAAVVADSVVSFLDRHSHVPTK